MNTDIRQSPLYSEAAELYARIRRPGSGSISDAAEVHASPDGRHAVFSGTLMESLDQSPSTQLCEVDLASGRCRTLSSGAKGDRKAQYSPDGRLIAFVSDRHRRDDFQLYLLERDSCRVIATPWLDGWVEYLRWSPDGRQILLGVAGHGADTAGGHGAIPSAGVSTTLPSWAPTVDCGPKPHQWRRLCVYDVAAKRARIVSGSHLNVWEACWCGNEAIVAIASRGPAEGLWYQAELHLIDLPSGGSRTLFAPRDQLGWPSASPSGEHVAVVEAICSDRWIVAGDLGLIERASGAVSTVDTRDVDVTFTEWRSNRTLLFAGHRGFETVVGLYDLVSRASTEIWSGSEMTSGGMYAAVSGIGDAGDFVMLTESFRHAPALALIQDGQCRTVKSFDVGFADEARVIGDVRQVRWHAPDGLDIQGWLVLPKGCAPFPTIMSLHGGPVLHWRPFWPGRRSAPMLMLLKRGFACFFPNPRGSSGRGQAFARAVLGDMGGKDATDCLAGLDYLVSQGLADPARIGVTGLSYGGFMAAWLITQDSRFAAAVPVCPVTHQVTHRLLSNIPEFVDLFLAERYNEPSGKAFARSPVMFADRVNTPTLIVCGAQDRCTPPQEGMQFHNALLGNGARSVLVTYPEEGHGIRKFPAAIDFAARVVSWFEKELS